MLCAIVRDSCAQRSRNTACGKEERRSDGIRPFPSCLIPLFQSESWCIAIHMKMSFNSHADETHFKRFARDLALKKRQETIRKWPIRQNVRRMVIGNSNVTI